MKIKFHLLAILCFALLASQAQEKQDRPVSNFSYIEVSGVFKVFIRTGDKAALTIVADDHVINNVETEVDNGVLEIELDSEWWESNNNIKVLEAYITVTELKGMDISGACVVETKNTLSGNNIEIEASGASKINAKLSYTSVELDLSGASKLELTGNCGELFIEGSGASMINAAHLQAKNVNVDVSGASKVSVHATNKLNIDASGASKISYKGNPSIKKDVSGASSVTALN